MTGTVQAATYAVRRRLEIDWLRGLAVLFMVLWHVVDAWHVPTSRDTRAFAAVVFFGGWAAPMFLFFAGLSLPLAAEARMARGLDRSAAAAALVRRGWQVFLLAHLFRLQSWLLSPGASWSALLKPDILNVLGLGLVLAGLAWRRARSWRGQCLWLLLPALVVAVVLTPWVRDWWWPSLLPPRIEGYIRIRNGNAVFSLFPALAYVFAGTLVGARLVGASAQGDRAFHRHAALAGIVLLGVSLGSRYLVLPAGVAAWTAPGLIVALRIGAMLVALPAAARAFEHVRLPASDPLLAFGRASLIVYWVHVELAYGSVSRPLHKALALPGALAGYLAVTAAMYIVALWWMQRPRLHLVPPHLASTQAGAGHPGGAERRWAGGHP